MTQYYVVKVLVEEKPHPPYTRVYGPFQNRVTAEGVAVALVTNRADIIGLEISECVEVSRE